MNTETFVVICMYLCGCTLLFDLLFSLYEALEKHNQPRRMRKLGRWLSRQLARLAAGGTLDSATQLKLQKKLGRPLWLEAFLLVLAEQGESQAEVLNIYFQNSLPLLIQVAKRLRNSAPEYRAQFAYLLRQLRLGAAVGQAIPNKRLSLHELAECIVPDVIGASVYLRENTWRAVLSIGDGKAIRHSLQLLNEDDEGLNRQLFTDDLLEYPHGCQSLMALVEADCPGFRPPLQVALINYMRLQEEAVALPFVHDMLKLLRKEQINGEVRLAAIRFFRKQATPAAYPELLRLLQTEDANYNYAAVAASTLRSYPWPQTVEALLAQLGNKDWYVRFNCADSLLALGVDYEALVNQNQDRYAREMLIYRGEIRLLRQMMGEGVTG